MGRERLRERFKYLKDRGEKALVSYLMVGYPTLETSIRAIDTVIESGTDILELGFPFSDPVADGPTIQKAHDVALRQGVRFSDVLEVARALRGKYPDIPFLLMTYYNPIFRIGLDRFCGMCSENGIDGFIVPDLPPEECSQLKDTMVKYNMTLVLLASPTSTERRLRLICSKTQEMTYFVSITGTTGARDSLPVESIRRRIEAYRELCDKPVVVGFGVSSGEQVRMLSEFADGVVVGSLLVRLAGENRIQELGEKVRELKQGTRWAS
jgi:tryptophan synthase alpha chain